MTLRHERTIEWLIWGAIFLLLAADRYYKAVVSGEDKIINPFIALSIQLPKNSILILSAAILVWIFIEAFRAFKNQKRIYAIGLLAIGFGGISNAYDRVVYGHVIDYVQIAEWFPVFNAADVLIILGVGIVGLYYLSRSHEYDH